jgi:polar amino acid transport system substrate-binding protein
MMGKGRRSAFFGATSVVFAILAATAGEAASSGAPAPNFWDPDLRLERPDTSRLRAIRFLTSDDYPPLDFTLPDGTLTGFNVELARAICEELEIGCTIQARRFDTLIDSLTTGKGDAVIASLATTPAMRAQVDFSHPYYQTPGRFIVRKGAAGPAIDPVGLAGKTVGVVAGSAHEAYLRMFFLNAQPKAYKDVAALQAALGSGEVPLAFADGLTFAVWLNGAAPADCCAFTGGPYAESRFFGEGVGIAVRKDDDALRQALDWALAKLAAKGVYAELYLKYFPVGFY